MGAQDMVDEALPGGVQFRVRALGEYAVIGFLSVMIVSQMRNDVCLPLEETMAGRAFEGRVDLVE